MTVSSLVFFIAKLRVIVFFVGGGSSILQQKAKTLPLKSKGNQFQL